MTSPMLAAAINYVSKYEFSVIPVRRSANPDLDKTSLIKWETFQRRLPTEQELESWWSRWPDANVAIVTGKLSGLLVVDCDGPQGLEWMREHLPVTGVYVRSRKGWHAYYRYPEGPVLFNRVRFAPELDIRAEGGYIVAPPSIHGVSGLAYQYEYTPGLNGWDDLAVYEPETRAPAVPGRAIDLSGVKPLLSADPVPRGQRNDTLTRLVGQWLQQGMAPELCLLTATGWNSLLPEPLAAAEVRGVVESVVKTDLRNHPEKARPPLVEVVAPDSGPQETDGLPEELLHPGGLLEMIMDYTRASSAVSHPVFALAGALATVGTLVGQKFQTETGLRTNLYCIALGHSGAGKDAPQAAVPQILNRSRAAACLGPNALTSEAAVLRWLSSEARARSVFFLDEIGLLLQGLKRPNSPAQEVPALLMKLFSSTDRGHIKPYASGENIEVCWHHLSFYGASTPDRFWDSLTRSEATDGFLARCLVFESRHPVERPRSSVDTLVPPALIAALDDLADIVPALAGAGNLRQVPAPAVVPKSPDAAAWFAHWADRYHELRNDWLKQDEGIAAIYGRAAEHAHKLALVHAAGRLGPTLKDRQVDLEAVRWAGALVDHLMANTVRQIEENLAESDFHKLAQRAMRAVRNYCLRKKKPGAPRWVIEKNLKGSPVRVVNEVLEKLQQEGTLTMQPFQGRSGPATTLFCPARRIEE